MRNFSIFWPDLVSRNGYVRNIYGPIWPRNDESDSRPIRTVASVL